MLNQQTNTDLSPGPVQLHSSSVSYKHELVNVVSIDMGIKNVSVCKFLWTCPVPAVQPKHYNTFSSASNIATADSPIVAKLENHATVKVGESFQRDTTFQKKYLETLESLLQFGNPWVKSNETDTITLSGSNSSKGSAAGSDSLFAKKSCNPKSDPFPYIELPIIYSWERLDLEQLFQPGALDMSKWQPFGLEHLNFLATNLVEAITQPPPDLPICDTNMAKSQDPSENLKPITKIKTTQPKNDNIEKKQELRPKTLVLIERQRFRSSSSSNILEWTLRINRLEMAVYSILKSLRQNVIVHSISPKAVLNYWKMVYPDLVSNQQTDDSSDYTETSALETKNLKKGKKQNTKDVYKLGKQTKLDIAARIIQDSTMFGNPGVDKKTDTFDPVLGIGLYSGTKDQHDDPVGTPANAVLSSSSWFKQSPMHVRLQKKNGIGATGSHHNNGTMAGSCQVIADSYNYELSLLEKPKKTKVGGKLKADDLADSMLQGLAWCNWQRNIDKVCDLLMSNSRNGSEM